MSKPLIRTAWTGLVACAFVMTACGQGGGSASNTQSISPPAAPSASSSQSAGAASTPCPDGTSTSTSTTSNFPSAEAAGIAGIEAKTGICYCPAGCVQTSFFTGAQVFGNTDPVIGLNAAYVQANQRGGAANGICYAYVIYDSAGWHYTTPVVCPQRAGYNPVLGTPDHVTVPGSCANVRSDPSLSARVITCIPDGTAVAIDSLFPRYRDGHIWWSINSGQGWMAHDFLISS